MKSARTRVSIIPMADLISQRFEYQFIDIQMHICRDCYHACLEELSLNDNLLIVPINQ